MAGWDGAAEAALQDSPPVQRGKKATSGGEDRRLGARRGGDRAEGGGGGKGTAEGGGRERRRGGGQRRGRGGEQ